MATTKKTTKKTTPKRKPATNKTTKPRAKPVAASKQKPRSLRLQRSQVPFFTFAITRQTIYWLIFMLLILGLGLWVVNLQDKINRIYDQVDANSAQLELTPEDYKKLKDAADKKSN